MSRPQLKRDPLGGALPPHKFFFVNFFGMVVRGAPCAETRERVPVRRAPPPHGRAIRRAAPRFSLRAVGCPESTSQPEGRRGLQAPRGALERRMKCAPSNMRLKLAGGDRFKGSGVFAPWRARTGVQHSCADGRVARSLSAIR